MEIENLGRIFKSYGNRKREDIRHIVLHETLSRSLSGSIRSLRDAKGASLGTHFFVSYEGDTIYIANPIEDNLAHASDLNKFGIGIDFLHTPRGTHSSNVGTIVVRKRWSWTGPKDKQTGKQLNPDRLFSIPPIAQLETGFALVSSLNRSLGGGFICPAPESGKRFPPSVIPSLPKCIVAHGRLDKGAASHSDGWVHERYVYHRMRGMDPQSSYELISQEE